MPYGPNYEDLQDRIKAHLESCAEPAALREIVIAWHGYLAALIEWSLITPSEHLKLHGLMPEVEPSPATQILLGVDGQYE